MTFREKYKADHGYDIVVECKKNGIYPCPSKYSYEEKNPAICRRLLDCKSCWEREMPETETVDNGDMVFDYLKKAVVKSDSVNHPSHYTKGGIECIDAIEAATDGLIGFEAVCTAQVIKYIWRWKWKGGIEDLKKARWYLDRLIAKVGKK